MALSDLQLISDALNWVSSHPFITLAGVIGIGVLLFRGVKQ